MPTPSPHAPENDKSTHLHWQCVPMPRCRGNPLDTRRVVVTTRMLGRVRQTGNVCAEPLIASRTLASLTPLRGGLRPSWTRPSAQRNGDQRTAGAVREVHETAIGGTR